MTIRVAEGRSIVAGEQCYCLPVATESHHHDRGIQAQCIQCCVVLCSVRATGKQTGPAESAVLKSPEQGRQAALVCCTV